MVARCIQFLENLLPPMLLHLEQSMQHQSNICTAAAAVTTITTTTTTTTFYFRYTHIPYCKWLARTMTWYVHKFRERAQEKYKMMMNHLEDSSWLLAAWHWSNNYIVFEHMSLTRYTIAGLTAVQGSPHNIQYSDHFETQEVPGTQLGLYYECTIFGKLFMYTVILQRSALKESRIRFSKCLFRI